MPVFQTNVWVCELCGGIKSATEEVTPWTDKAVTRPKGCWEYLGIAPHEKLACPKCVKQEDTDIVLVKVDDVTDVDISTE
jgi:hypothetical protein